MRGPFLRSVRVANVVAAASFTAPLALLSCVFKNSDLLKRMKQLFYKGVRRAAGVHTVSITGEPVRSSVIGMSNHISYLDIVLLAQGAPYRFLAKQEVRKWTGIGWVAEALGTIFIQKTPLGLREGIDRVKKALEENADPLIIFPQATTSDNLQTNPFKPAFFEFRGKAGIQPISLAYTHVNGLPVTRFLRRQITWIGKSTFLGHLWSFAGFRSIEAKIWFHPVIECDTDRRVLAKKSGDIVQKGVSLLMKGETPWND